MSWMNASFDESSNDIGAALDELGTLGGTMPSQHLNLLNSPPLAKESISNNIPYNSTTTASAAASLGIAFLDDVSSPVQASASLLGMSHFHANPVRNGSLQVGHHLPSLLDRLEPPLKGGAPTVQLDGGLPLPPEDQLVVACPALDLDNMTANELCEDIAYTQQTLGLMAGTKERKSNGVDEPPQLVSPPAGPTHTPPQARTPSPPSTQFDTAASAGGAVMLLTSTASSHHPDLQYQPFSRASDPPVSNIAKSFSNYSVAIHSNKRNNSSPASSSIGLLPFNDSFLVPSPSVTGMTPPHHLHSSLVDSSSMLPSPTFANNSLMHNQTFQSPQALSGAASSSQHNSSLSLRLSLSPSQCTQPSQSGTTANDTNIFSGTNMPSQLECVQPQSHSTLQTSKTTIQQGQAHKQLQQVVTTSGEQYSANFYRLVVSECPPHQVNVSHSTARIGNIYQTATNGTTHATAGAAAAAASTSDGAAGVSTTGSDGSDRAAPQLGQEGGSGGEGGPGKQSNKRSRPKDREEDSTSHEASTSSDSSQDSNTPSKKAKRPATNAALPPPVMSTSTTTAWTASTIPRAVLTTSAARVDPPITLLCLGGAQHTSSGATERHESSSSWGSGGRLPRVSSQTDLFEGSEDFFAATADEEETDKCADQTPASEQNRDVNDLLPETVTGPSINPSGTASSTTLLQSPHATTRTATTAPTSSSVGQLMTSSSRPHKVPCGRSSPSSSSHGPSSSDTSSDEKVVVEYSKLKKNRDYEISPTLERRRRELSEAALPTLSSSLHPRRIHFSSDQSSSSDDRLTKFTEGQCKLPLAAVDTEEENDDDDVTVLNTFEQSLEVVYDAKTDAAAAAASKIRPTIDLDISDNVGSQDISLFLQADTQSFESQCIPLLEPSASPHDKSDLKNTCTTSKPIKDPAKGTEFISSGVLTTKYSSAPGGEKSSPDSDDGLPSMSSSESLLCHNTLSCTASDACIVEAESQQQQIPCTINPTQLQSLLAEAEHPAHSQSPDISPLLDEPLKQASVTGEEAKKMTTTESSIATQRERTRGKGSSGNLLSESDEGLSNGTSVRCDVASEDEVSSKKKHAVESSPKDSHSEVFIIEERSKTPPPPPPELSEPHGKLKLKSPTKYKDICHQSLIPSSNPISQSNSSSDSSSNGDQSSGGSDVIPLPGSFKTSQSSGGKKSADGIKEKSSSSSSSETAPTPLKITMPDINISQCQLSCPFPQNSGSIVAKASKTAKDNLLEAERKREEERAAEINRKQRNFSDSDSFCSLSLDTTAVIRPEQTPPAMPALTEVASSKIEVFAGPKTTASIMHVSEAFETAVSVDEASSAVPKSTAPRGEKSSATLKTTTTTPPPSVEISSAPPETASRRELSPTIPKTTVPRAKVSMEPETAASEGEVLFATPETASRKEVTSIHLKSPVGEAGLSSASNADDISEIGRSNITSPRKKEVVQPVDSSSGNIEAVSDRDARRTSTPNIGHLPQGVSPNISGEGGSYIDKEICTPNSVENQSTPVSTTAIPREDSIDGRVERSNSNRSTVELIPDDIPDVDSPLNARPLPKAGDISLEEFVPQRKFKTEVTVMKRSKDGLEIYSLKLGDKQIFLEDIYAKTKVFRTGSSGSTSSSDRRVSDVSTITSSSGYQADKSSSSSSCSRRMSTLSQVESTVSAPPPGNAPKTSRLSIESVQILSGPAKVFSCKDELDDAGGRLFALPSSTRPLKTRSPRVPPMITIEENNSSSDDKDSAAMTPTSRSYSSFKASRSTRAPITKVRSLIAEEASFGTNVSEDSPRIQLTNTEVVDLTASESASVEHEPDTKLQTPEVKASPRSGITNKGLHYDLDKFFEDLPPSIVKILRSVQMSGDEEDIFLKSDTCSMSALDVHEEQARMVISRMISVKIVPNILVFAKYQDHYYSAVIESENPSGGWNIKYTLDGFQKNCPIEHILPIDILPRGQHCFRRYQGSNNRKSIVSMRVVIQGHSVENGAVLHIAADTQQVFKVPHSHLSMQLVDAERFVNAWKVTQSIVSGGPEVSMQNIIYGKRRRAPASPSTLTPEAGRLPPQQHYTPSKPRSAPVRKKKLAKPDPNMDTSLTETDFHAGEGDDHLMFDAESSDSCHRPRKKQAMSARGAGSARSSANSCSSSVAGSDALPVVEKVSSPPKHPRLSELLEEAITDDDPSDDESYSPKSSSSKKRTPRKSTPRLTRKKKSSSPGVGRLVRGVADDDDTTTPAIGTSELTTQGSVAPEAISSPRLPEKETEISSIPSRLSKESKVSKIVVFDLHSVSAEIADGEETLTTQDESSSKKLGRKPKVKASKTSMESPVQVNTKPVAGAQSATSSKTTPRKRGRPPAGSSKESSDSKSSKVAKLELNRVDESEEADTSLQEESASPALINTETTSTKLSTTTSISSPPRRSRTRSSSTESSSAAAASLLLTEIPATASAPSTSTAASSLTAACGIATTSTSLGASPSGSRNTRGGRSKTGVSRGGRRQLKLDDEASVGARMLSVVEEREGGVGEKDRACPLREEPLLEASSNPRLGTVPSGGSNIFAGYTVLITMADVKQRSLEEEDDHDEEDEVEEEEAPPLNKRHLTEQLRAGGAMVIAKFEEADLIRVRNVTFRSFNPRSRASTSSSSAPDAIEDSLPQLLLLCDNCCRTSKYIQCLAVGIPIVSHRWVIAACDMNQRLPWSEYLLPAGVDAVSNNLVEQSNTVTLVSQGDTVRDTPLLEGDVVFVASSSNEQFAVTWLPLLANAAAEVRRAAKSNASLGRILDRKTTVVLADSSIPEAELARARQLDKPVVSSEWFIQSIIMGYKLPCDYHPSFRHDYK